MRRHSQSSSPGRGKDGESVLRRSCLGRSLPKTGRLLIALGLSVVPNLDAHTRQHLADPFLVFVPVAWTLFVFATVFPFLRHPRTENFPFVIGLDYAKRREEATLFVRQGLRDLATVLVMAIPIFLLVRWIVAGSAAMPGATSIAALVVGSGLFWGGVLWAVNRFSLIHPIRHDRGRHLFTMRSRSGVRVLLTGAAGAASRYLAAAAPGRVRPVLRRQILYLFRYDWFAFVFFGMISVPLAAVVFHALAPHYREAAYVFLACVPVVLFFQVTPSLAASAEAASKCPFWWFRASDLFRANLLVGVGMGFPFVIIFLFGAGLPLSLAGMALAGAFLWCLGTVIFFFATRWLVGESSGAMVATFGVTAMCVMMGLVGAAKGSVLHAFGFPLLPVLLTGWNARAVLRERGTVSPRSRVGHPVS